jgi:hypothetical protein
LLAGPRNLRRLAKITSAKIRSRSRRHHNLRLTRTKKARMPRREVPPVRLENLKSVVKLH